MRVSVKAFSITLVLQVLYFLILWFTPDGQPGSQADVSSGFLAAILFVFYLLPIGVLAAPFSTIFGNRPAPFPFQIVLIAFAVLFYAFLIGLLFGFFRKPKNRR